jgi:DNA polymerase I
MLGVPFRRIWCIHFEFIARKGENLEPVCLVATEVGTGRLIRLWQDQFGPEPPFDQR